MGGWVVGKRVSGHSDPSPFIDGESPTPKPTAEWAGEEKERKERENKRILRR